MSPTRLWKPWDGHSSTIKVVPTGVSKSMKKLVVKNKIPDLSKYEDVADFFEK